MSRFVRLHALSRFALLVAVGAGAHRHAGAQVPSGAAAPKQGQEQVLLLEEGGVLTGRIARQGERYVVTRAGVQMEVAAPRVLVVCGSLEEAYQYRRRQLTRPTAEAHLTLAEWCLRFNLFGPARAELAAARALDARHPRIALLERRLEYAGREPAGSPVAKSTKPAEAVAVESTKTSAPATAGVSPRALERFTRKVQPVLVNNCTTSGCHQPGGGQPFQLDRALLHGMANRRSTMSNLSAALALVDRERPQLSPLLTVPRRAHGGMDEPLFGTREEQAFAHLEQWVALVTQSDSARSPDATQPDADAGLAAAEEVPAAAETATTGVVQADFEAAAKLTPAAPQLRVGAQIKKWQPRDPFDPEIFNRQMVRRRVAGSAESNSPVGP